jgi:hypothetical protein
MVMIAGFSLLNGFRMQNLGLLSTHKPPIWDIKGAVQGTLWLFERRGLKLSLENNLYSSAWHCFRVCYKREMSLSTCIINIRGELRNESQRAPHLLPSNVSITVSRMTDR